MCVFVSSLCIWRLDISSCDNVEMEVEYDFACFVSFFCWERKNFCHQYHHENFLKATALWYCCCWMYLSGKKSPFFSCIKLSQHNIFVLAQKAIWGRGTVSFIFFLYPVTHSLQVETLCDNIIWICYII